MHNIHTRIWWMEIARGLITITFAFLIFILRGYSIKLLIYALGFYLIIDGCIDIYKVATGKRISQHKFHHYLGSTISVVVGIISFVSPSLTIILLAWMMAIRVIIRGIRVFNDARKLHGKSAGLTWLYGILVEVCALVLLIFPVLTLTYLVYFIAIYSFFDGAYLLTRGLLLRFAPHVLSAYYRPASEILLDLPANLPATTRRALVFVRRSGATGLGHIAWAFEWPNGWFNAGSVEDIHRKPFAKPEEMGFWNSHTLDPIGAMQKQQSTYDEYKVYHVQQPRPKDAWKTVVWESREPYSLVRHNCNDVAYDVLRAFGVTDLLDPAKENVPNDWYDALPGATFPIEKYPVVPLRLHKLSQRELATNEITITIPPRIQGNPPPWREQGFRAWIEITDAWDKMLADVAGLFVSAEKAMTKR
jgi:uncharacterized membrane protein HdeD (DUF308 family)